MGAMLRQHSISQLSSERGQPSAVLRRASRLPYGGPLFRFRTCAMTGKQQAGLTDKPAHKIHAKECPPFDL